MSIQVVTIDSDYRQVTVCLGAENGALSQQCSHFLRTGSLRIPVGTTDKSVEVLSGLREAPESTVRNSPYVALGTSSALRKKAGVSPRSGRLDHRR